MAISVRMDPLLEKELELAARRQGVTKSQFIIEAVQRALGRRDPYELMERLIAEEQAGGHAAAEAFKGQEIPYDTAKSRAALVGRLKDKRRAGGAG